MEGQAAAPTDKLAKQTLDFVSLRSALSASWRSLRIKRTAKLFFVVQGTPHASLAPTTDMSCQEPDSAPACYGLAVPVLGTATATWLLLL